MRSAWIVVAWIGWAGCGSMGSRAPEPRATIVAPDATPRSADERTGATTSAPPVASMESAAPGSPMESAASGASGAPDTTRPSGALTPMTADALLACARDAVDPGDAKISIAPLPPPDRPPPDRMPLPGRLERNASVADRFGVPAQRVQYAFECEAGELSLLALETWGYARGWRSTARLRVLDAEGDVLADAVREGPSVYYHLVPFVAPAKGSYRCELAAEAQCYRYRITRLSGLRARTAGEIERLGRLERVKSYLASGSDVARYAVDLEAGEEIALKAMNADEAGRTERRAVNPPRLGAGSLGGFVYPTFELEVALDGVVVVPRCRSVFLRAPRKGTYVVAVSAVVEGSGGLFDLEARRRVHKIPLRGHVLDRDDAPIADALVTVLHGIDRDPVGAVRTDRDGSWAIDVPPGRLRLRVERDAISAEIDAVVDTPRELDLVP